jgi:hypothetical protein
MNEHSLGKVTVRQCQVFMAVRVSSKTLNYYYRYKPITTKLITLYTESGYLLH